MKSVNELIEGYFEGYLSQDEETALKVFLASEEGQGPEYDEIRAVMGYFAAGRSVIFGNTKAITSRRSICTFSVASSISVVKYGQLIGSRPL